MSKKAVKFLMDCLLGVGAFYIVKRRLRRMNLLTPRMETDIYRRAFEMEFRRRK